MARQGNDMAMTWQRHGHDMAMTWQWHGDDMALPWQYHGMLLQCCCHVIAMAMT
jgi:hypothetical protein